MYNIIYIYLYNTYIYIHTLSLCKGINIVILYMMMVDYVLIHLGFGVRGPSACVRKSKSDVTFWPRIHRIHPAGS